jgi:hypothetical protein
LFGRDCLIYNCNAYTNQYYKEQFGITQEPIVLKQERVRRFYQPVPPYTGFGSEEDSLGSVRNLQPKPPKTDFNKMFTSDQFILRFEARMISDNEEDNSRKFIVSFFCGDDTTMVYQTCERNSGITAGKFIERTKF